MGPLREVQLAENKQAARKPAWQKSDVSPSFSSHLEKEQEAWPVATPEKLGKPSLGLMGLPRPGSSGSQTKDPADQRSSSARRHSGDSSRHSGDERKFSEQGKTSSGSYSGSNDKENVRGSQDLAKKGEQSRREDQKVNRPSKRVRILHKKEHEARRGEEREDGSYQGSKKPRYEERPERREEIRSRDRILSGKQNKAGTKSGDLRDLLSSGSSRHGSGQKTGSGGTYYKKTSGPVQRQGGKGKLAGTGFNPRDHQTAGSGSTKVGSKKVTVTVSKKRFISQEMLPSPDYQIMGDLVQYKKDFLEVEFSREYKEDKVRQNLSVAHPSRNVLVVDSLHNPDLLVPTADLPSAVKDNPRLLLLPKVVKSFHHAGEGQDCDCLSYSLSGRYHREAVMPDSCLKLGRLSPYETCVKPAGVQFQENPAHYYTWDPVRKDHYLAVPPPFPVGGSWPSLHFEPAMASKDQGPMVDLYYGLYDQVRFREVAATYQRSPKDWTPQESPVLCEAPLSNEVGMLAHRFFGLESIPRMGFAAHPAAEPRILLYPAMCRQTRGVPVLYQDMKHPSKLDMVLGEILRPFWEGGLGSILCPVCLIEVRQDGQAHPVFLSRHAFLQHWERNHYSSQVAAYTFSATQLHTRLYMGQAIYTLALSSRHRGKDNVSGMPVNVDVMIRHGVTDYDLRLQSMFPPEVRKTSVEVIDLLDQVEDISNPCEDAMEAIDRFLNEPGPRETAEVKMEKEVTRGDLIMTEVMEAAQVEPEAMEMAEAALGAAGVGVEEPPFTLVTKAKSGRKEKRK